MPNFIAVSTCMYILLFLDVFPLTLFKCQVHQAVVVLSMAIAGCDQQSNPVTMLSAQARDPMMSSNGIWRVPSKMLQMLLFGGVYVITEWSLPQLLMPL